MVCSASKSRYILYSITPSPHKKNRSSRAFTRSSLDRAGKCAGLRAGPWLRWTLNAFAGKCAGECAEESAVRPEGSPKGTPNYTASKSVEAARESSATCLGLPPQSFLKCEEVLLVLLLNMVRLIHHLGPHYPQETSLSSNIINHIHATVITTEFRKSTLSLPASPLRGLAEFVSEPFMISRVARKDPGFFDLVCCSELTVEFKNLL